MGTLLQQYGHDAVLLYFIDKIIKPREKEKFLIVSPAEGPYIDIHYWNPEHNEFTSGFNEIDRTIGRGYYIPELQYRKRINPKTLEAIDKQFRREYASQQWYKELSDLLNEDPKKFVKGITKVVENETGDLPDIIGIDQNGNQTLCAEIKFEGYSEKSQKSVLKQFYYAFKRGLPFYLVLPKQRVYSRDLSTSWVRNWVEENISDNEIRKMTIYQSDIKGNIVTPKQKSIEFIHVHGGEK